MRISAVAKSRLWLVLVSAAQAMLVAFIAMSVLAAGVHADASSSQPPTGSAAGSLGLSGANWLTGTDETRAAQEAVLASPEAVAERARSRTEYEGLNGPGAVSLAERTFGIQRPVWKGPTLGDAGARVERYLGESEAVEVLPGGKRVVAQSSVPLRSAVGSGQLEPLSLSLQSEGGVYEPVNPLLPVSISKQADGGVAFPFGISVTPVQAAEPEAASIVGDRVVYPGTARDTDYMVEPLAAGGVDVSWQLLSEESPQENSLRFSLPTGASLQMSATVPGEAEVVSEGDVILRIPPAEAVEADGVTLPVSYSLNSNVLSTHVDLSGGVAYPVMVDPIVYGSYGHNGAGRWNGWKFYSNCGCIDEVEQEGLLQTYTEPGPANGDDGEWSIAAPGWNNPHGAKIARVWIDEMTHQPSYQSTVNAEIGGEDTGSGPVWTDNGAVKSDTKPAPMVRDEGFTEDLEFCAQGEGGTGEELCNDNYGADEFDFLEVMGPEARTVDNYTQITGAIVWYLDTGYPTEVKLEDLPSGWVQHGPTYPWIYAKDEGTGISTFRLEIPPGHVNGEGHAFNEQVSSCEEEAGFNGCPQEANSQAINFSELATGVYTLGVSAESPVKLVREEVPAPHLYVDHTPPKIEPLSGSLVEHASKVGAGDYTLNFRAVDGSESEPQSGMHVISVAVDGKTVDTIKTSCSKPTGVPAAECYGLSGSWVMEGEHYGPGAHTITVTATDWAGNESTETLHVTVSEAGYETVGPGAVNLQTGNFKLVATDVSVAGNTAGLSLARSYESRNTSAGSGGPLGPQWALSLPDAAAAGVWQSLQVEPNGNVAATMVGGVRLSFARSGSSFTSPAGYQTETLTGYPAEKPSEYKLTNAAGDQTIFKHAEHEEESVYTPVGVAQASGAGGLNKVTYTFEKTTEGVVEPTAVIAPSPAGLECAKEFVKGCRELTFNYAASTTASGEGPEQWGDYKGRLTRVYLHAWNPNAGSKGEMTTTAIAHYAYDGKGRLRAEWNPQTELEPEKEKCVGHLLASGCLVTSYGYNEEGLLTAVRQPGQQPWALIYGTVAGDGNEGRLIKALQAPASTSLWKGEAVASTEAPKLSGSPVTGVRMAITGGKWSGSPVAYGYRWEDCNKEGHACSTIAGADNGNYTPTSKDLGEWIVGQIIATNAGGSVIASSTPSGPVSEPGEAVTVTKIASGLECPALIAKGPEGAAWFTDSWSCNNKIGKITSSLETSAFSVSSLRYVQGIVEGPSLTMWVTEESASKIVKLTKSGTVSGEYSLPAESNPVGIVEGPSSELWFTDFGTGKIGKITVSGAITEYTLKESSSYPEPYEITEGPESTLWFTEYGANKIGKITPSGTITEYSLPVGSKPVGIAEGPDGNLWFTEEASSKIGKITTSGTITEYPLPAGSGPYMIAAGPEGDLRFTELKAEKIGQITTSGEISEYTLPPNSTPNGIVSANDGHHIWFTEYLTNSIGRIATKETISTSEGEAVAAQPGWTIEYNVPVSGSGAPDEMGSSEVAKWGQSDDPISATAIIPPSESKSQGWPASSYTQASIYYLDSQQRTVNIANPAGGISTTEYNTSNDDVERALTADNRATAIKAGSKSVEVAEHLATESKYNGEGTELTSTLGPEHKIKLPGGEEVQARKHTVYSYDEGAPAEGGPYYLVTKTTETAKLASGEEKDRRTITDSYSGQEGLGWKLNAATSTTTAPASIDQTHTSVYNKETGSVIETKTPGGNAETVSPPVFSSTFGKAGGGGGQFKEASAVAAGLSGEVFADDRGDGRIEKFSSSGSFEGAFESKLGKFSGSWGIAVSPKTGDVFVADSGHNEIIVFSPAETELRSFGSTGEGALKEPTGISVTPTGEVWVADNGANKVEEFTEEGKYLASVGEGHLKEPSDVTVDDGNLYVTSEHSVAMFTHQGEYTGSFGSHGSGAGQFASPTEIVAAPGTGDLSVVDGGNERVEEFNPAGKFLTEWGAPGSGNGEFSGISGLAISSSGTIYTSETGGDRVQEFTPAQAGAVREVYSTQWGSHGSGHGEFLYTGEPAVTSNGDVLVTDNEADNVQKFTDQGKYLATFGTKGEGKEQMSGPTGLTVNQSTGEVLVAECANDRVQVLNSEGKYVREFGRGQLSCPGAVALDSSGDAWVADSAKNRIAEYGTTGTYITAYGSEGSGHVQFKDPSDIKVLGSDIYVSDTHNDRVEILNLKGEWVGQIGSEGNGGGQFNHPEGLAFNSASDLFVLDSGNSRIEEFNPEGHFLQSIATHGVGEGQLNAPQGIAVTPAGDIYAADAGNHRIEKWIPDSQAVHDSKTIYYTVGTNSEHTECGGHAEWANLPCRTEPAAQPETEGLPALPITTYTYNLYDEPTVTESTSGESKRVETDSYDAAGRLTSKKITASVGVTMPEVTYHYNSETGALEKQTASGHTTTSVYNSLGQLTSYTDGNEGTSTYKYNIDGRVTEENTPYGSQTYTYNETTGLETKLVDSAAKTFTATYDGEGNLASETLPDGLTACYAYNATGEATGLEYRKSTSCESGTVWFSDSTTPTIHSQWAAQTSSLSSETYGYDETGRLTEVQETPASKGCTVRLYSLDEEGNRTSLTTRQPGTEGKCATEGGTIQRHTYDPANRLADEGVEYNPFGDITTLPASDAGGSAALESHYYADGQAAEQAQEGVTLAYQLDPARRISEITTTSSKTSSILVNHYAGEGSSPAWTTETGGKWTRYIYGISGALAAIQTDSETPELQISNLHGDIIATAADEEAATKLLSSTNTTEYGVPTISSPKRYSWLGTQMLPTEFPSGVAAMGARSYVPQLGRFLQPDPQPGGSENAYAYTHGNPLNEADPSGEYTITTTSGGLSAVGTGEGQQLPGGVGIAAGAIMPAPVNTQLEAAFWANPPWDQETAGNEEYEEYEEYEEEEGGYEYASAQQSTEGHTESGVLLAQPLERFEDQSGEPEAESKIFIVGGCPSTHDPCYPKGKKSGGGGGKGYECRSGGKRNKKGRCEEGKPDKSNGCADVGSALGGIVGGGIGTAAAGAGGGLAGAAIGGEAGTKAGEAACG